MEMYEFRGEQLTKEQLERRYLVINRHLGNLNHTVYIIDDAKRMGVEVSKAIGIDIILLIEEFEKIKTEIEGKLDGRKKPK